eukprot:TRINITY_DN9168_c0_g1_i2.p1 TRINITY_DN9168_c0_g1~~TRINITY_DN9168_c0_g1_i2.p1  ORF type:complete len:656 (+),score=146.07 TRINITY_DN9168_c0_g1_i2:821-2788(+)
MSESLSIDVDTILEQSSPCHQHLKPVKLGNGNDLQSGASRDGIELLFHDLKYSVDISKNNTKQILHGISGKFGSLQDGELVACMGQSGAGKTSFLNVLAQRASGTVTGTVMVNQQVMNREVIRRMVGYVHQADNHYPELTVLETLKFVAGLTMVDATPEQRAERVRQVLDMLNLAHVANTKVGVPTGVAGEARGISGGELKRLSIAEVMLHQPKIIFLDEYTSGLDSPTALVITKLLKQISHRGHLIVATVHQPSSAIFFNFDKLCLLAQGRLVFLGPSAQSIPYFDALFPNNTCPQYSNPAEHLAEIVHVDAKSKSGQSLDLADEFAQHRTYREMLTYVQAQVASAAPATRRGSRQAPKGDVQAVASVKTSLLYQTRWLIWRNWLVFTRNKLKTRAKLIIVLIMALMLGVIYLDLPQTLSGLSDRTFFLLNTSILVGARISMEVIRFFQTEKHVVLRHTEQGMFGALAYVTSRIVAELPGLIFFPLLFLAIAGPMVGLQLGGANFLIHWCALILINLNAYGYGLFMGSLIVNDDVLAVVAPMILFPLLLFSGIAAVNIPAGLNWISYLVYLRYGILMMFVTEIQDLDFYSGCSEAQFRAQDPNCTITTSDEILDDYNMQFVSRWEAAFISLGLFVVMWIGASLGIHRIISKRHS